MTSTISPHDAGDIRLGEGTRDLTYLTQRPGLRRPDVTGEQPVYEPATIAIVSPMRLADADTQILLRGSAELARLQLGETMVLPVDADPAPPRHAAPTVYPPGPAVSLAEVLPQPQVRPPGYRGRYRKAPWPRWAFGTLMFGSGWASCAATILVGLFALAATR